MAVFICTMNTRRIGIDADKLFEQFEEETQKKT
jgi:hypothetical protein